MVVSFVRKQVGLGCPHCSLPIIWRPASKAGGTLQTCEVMMFCRYPSLYSAFSSIARNASQTRLTLVLICSCESFDFSTKSLVFKVSLYIVSETSSLLLSLANCNWCP